jgi:hypothetical protein
MEGENGERDCLFGWAGRVLADRVSRRRPGIAPCSKATQEEGPSQVRASGYVDRYLSRYRASTHLCLRDPVLAAGHKQDRVGGA